MTVPGKSRLSELMARYQAGDLGAFEEIYQETVAGVERYLARRNGPAGLDDLVQEVYLQVHRARRTFRPERPFEPWLFAIARHVSQMAARTRGRQAAREVPIEQALSQHGELQPGHDVLGRRRLVSALRRLPDAQWEALRLTYVAGFSSAEIAARTGSTAGAIKVRLHRAHARLRAWLRAAPPENRQTEPDSDKGDGHV